MADRISNGIDVGASGSGRGEVRMSARHRVVAGIDYGTYGTGFAWIPVSRENDDLQTRRISFFENWPGQTLTYPKNRTALLLDADGNVLAWGDQVDQRMDSMPADAGWKEHVGFKMGLQRDLDPASQGAVGAGLVLPEGSDDAYRLTVQCLREVISVSRDLILKGPYHESEIRWCLTVPAIWDPYTRDLMFKAAVEAGLPDDPDRLVLVKEPAAAALHCMARQNDLLGSPGTRFLVVDAGGGTVDLTSYRVEQGRRLNELTRASGAKAGSQYLNQTFLGKVLPDRFGIQAVHRLISDYRAAFRTTVESWEKAKRAFGPTSDDVVIPLGAPLYKALLKEFMSGRWEGCGEPDTEIVVPRDLVASIFDDNVREIISLIKQQLEEMRRLSGTSGNEVILLVGGFAESPYLQSRIGEYLRSQGLRLVVPPRPAIAVLAGAVHYAYDPSVLNAWRAPFTLGVGSSMTFRTGHDPEHLKFTSDLGETLCRDRFDMSIKNLQEVNSDHVEKREYTPVTESQTTVDFQLYTTSRVDAEYTSDQGLKQAGMLTVKLSDSMHLPLAERKVEVATHFEPARIRVTARNLHSGEPETTYIDWRPTW